MTLQPAWQDDAEEASVTLLTSMMGNADPGMTDTARRVLRKHKGDVQKAAAAMIDGDTGEEEAVSWPTNFSSLEDPDPTVGPRTPPREHDSF